jgi:hypothetical protein
MGWFLRKSIRVLPGVRLNLSKSGPRLSVGVPGARASIDIEGKALRRNGPSPLSEDLNHRFESRSGRERWRLASISQGYLRPVTLRTATWPRVLPARRHTPIAVVPVLFGAPGHSPLIADHQSLSLIQKELLGDRP